MRYLALACDYDGTLAHHGTVDAPTVAALERLVASGRKLIMVTGRELDELLAIFPQIHLFERVVAENGALLYRPGSGEAQPLADRPPDKFIAELSRRGVTPISVGRAIVATWQPHETAVLGAIRDLGLELQVIFNKGAVMILPAGVNKATGLRAALTELGLSPQNVVGVGDAENDHAFLQLCHYGVAVANALPTLKEQADIVTARDHGAGVSDLIDEIIADDLAQHEPRLKRQALRLGDRPDGELHVPPYGTQLLVSGPPASGKTPVAAAILERLAASHYQFCLIDTQGDYPSVHGTVVLGATQASPTVDEVLENLRDPKHNVVVNLAGMKRDERRSFCASLADRMKSLRGRTARPHWFAIDDAHDVLPVSNANESDLVLPADSVLLVTADPSAISPAALSRTEIVFAVGERPSETLKKFAAASGVAPMDVTFDPGDVLAWQRPFENPPSRVRFALPRSDEPRQKRKHAHGDLGPERSFYFRGPDQKLKLRANNVAMFLQLAEGVDEATWSHHLRQGDYSRWFGKVLQNAPLAAEIARIEALSNVPADESRKLVQDCVRQHYELPEASEAEPGST